MSLAAGILSFGACQEYQIDSQPEEPLKIQIDALENYTLVATAPSKIVFNISSNTPWTVESDRQWCVPSPAMSASSSLVSEVVVTVEDNTGKQARTATLTVKAEGIDTPTVIKIEQASKENLVVIPYDENVQTEGGKISFQLVSNKPWEIIPSTAFISNISKTSGEGREDGSAETIEITLPANPGAKRSGTLTVKTDYEEYSFTVTQNGVVIELEDSPADFNIVLEGSGNAVSTSYVIQSNTDWKVKSVDQDWLTASKEGNSLVLSAGINNRFSSRKAKVILTTASYLDGFDGVEFEVEQPVAFVLSAPAENFILDEATGNVKVMLAGGQIAESAYSFTTAALTVEFEEVNIAAPCNFAVQIDGGFNYKWICEKAGYSIYTGGSTGWVAKAVYQYDLMPLNDTKRLKFIVDEDPDNAGKYRLSLYRNDVLLDRKTGRNAPTAAKLYISGGTPAEGDYVIIKSITPEL